MYSMNSLISNSRIYYIVNSCLPINPQYLKIRTNYSFTLMPIEFLNLSLLVLFCQPN